MTEVKKADVSMALLLVQQIRLRKHGSRTGLRTESEVINNNYYY